MGSQRARFNLLSAPMPATSGPPLARQWVKCASNRNVRVSLDEWFVGIVRCEVTGRSGLLGRVLAPHSFCREARGSRSTCITRVSQTSRMPVNLFERRARQPPEDPSQVP